MPHPGTRVMPDPAAPMGPAQRPSRPEVIGHGIATTARWSLHLVAIALAAVVLGLLVQYGWYIIFPVMLALIIATVLAPISGFLRDQWGVPAGVASALSLLGALGVVVAAGFIIAPQVAGQSGQIAEDVNSGLQQLQAYIQDSDFVSANQLDQTLEGLQQFVTGSASSIASGVIVGVTAVTNAFITLLLSLILTFLFLKDGRKFLPWIGRLAGKRAGDHLVEVSSRAWNTLGGFIRAQALVSFIDAVFIGAGLLIVGVPLAVPLAIVTFFAGFVPIVGALVAGSLAVLVALVSNGLTGALIVLAIVVGVQQLEGNVLSPWLQSKSMQLHPAVVLLGVTLGSTLFGITGAFLAVPVVAVGAVVLRYLDEVVDARSGPLEPPYIEGEADADADSSEDNPRPMVESVEPASTEG